MPESGDWAAEQPGTGRVESRNLQGGGVEYLEQSKERK